MFRRIMAPVDLAHLDRLGAALQATADMAKRYDAPVVYVGVTTPQPSETAHSPQEFARKFEAFATSQAETHGIEASAHVAISHDPTVDLDDVLLKAVDDAGADLVVMASHIPGLADRFWPSNGGQIASHARTSVFIVRNR